MRPSPVAEGGVNGAGKVGYEAENMDRTMLLHHVVNVVHKSPVYALSFFVFDNVTVINQ